MHVYEYMTADRFVAESMDDAREVLERHLREVHGWEDEDDITEALDELEQTPDDKVMGIYCNAAGELCEVGEIGSTVVRRAAAEWAACQPRGFLCSSEY